MLLTTTGFALMSEVARRRIRMLFKLNITNGVKVKPVADAFLGFASVSVY